MFLVIKRKARALLFYYGAITDIVDPAEKVSMIIKYLLRSVSDEASSYFYHFTDDIKALYLELCLKFIVLLWIRVHDY